MPLLLNYTDDPVTDNEHTIVLTSPPEGVISPDFTHKHIIKFVISQMAAEKLDTVSLVLPDWDVTTTPSELGEVFRETDWDNHPSHVLTLVCKTPEMYDAINNYFQGSWHL